MKKIITAILFLIIVKSGQCQEATATWSEPLSMKETRIKNTIIYNAFYDKDNYYAVRREDDTYPMVFVDRYDKQLKFLSTSMVNPKILLKKKDEFLQFRFFTFQDISSFYLRNNNKPESMFGNISKEGSVTKNDYLSELLKEKYYSAILLNESFYSISDNDSLIVFYSSYNPKNKSNPSGTMMIHVFDANFKLLYQKDIAFPTTYPGGGRIYNIKIGNNGNIAILEQLYTKKDYSTSIYKVLYYDRKTDKSEEYEAYKGKGGYFSAISFDRNNDLIITGYSFNPKWTSGGVITSGNSPAYFYYKVDHTTKKTIVSKEDKLDNTLFLTDNNGIILKEKEQEKEYPWYAVKNIYPRNNGDNVVVLESGAGDMTSTYFSSKSVGSLIFICIKSDGTTRWVSRLAKSQLAYNSNYVSFLETATEENIYILYNDHPKNINTNEYKEIKMYDLTSTLTPNAMIVLATINSKGEITKQAISQPDEKNKVTVQTDSGCKIKDNELLFLAKEPSGTEYRLAHIKIK